MKKIIAAAAGLMLAGAMASTAFADAGVTFGGDARVRYYYQDNYNLVDSKDTHWASRVRLQFKAESKGGAYAVGRFRLADATWDGTQKTAKGGEASNLWVDKGYIGVPMGPVVVEGGMGYNTLNEFFRADIDTDFIRIKYATDATTLVGFFEKWDEYNDALVVDPVTATSRVVKEPASEDDDVDLYGIHAVQKFGGAWEGTFTGVYLDDQQSDLDGFGADMFVGGTAGTIGIAAELAYKEADLQGSDDDGLGGYFGVNVPVGAMSISATAGFTKDGYVASGDFDAVGEVYCPLIMLSDDRAISTGNLIGAGGDTVFVNVAPAFKVSEQLSLVGILAYADIDTTLADSALEVSGEVDYTISDGAVLRVMAGYLDIADVEENPVGLGIELEVSY